MWNEKLYDVAVALLKQMILVKNLPKQDPIKAIIGPLKPGFLVLSNDDFANYREITSCPASRLTEQSYHKRSTPREVAD